MDLNEAIEKRRTIRVFKTGASEDQLKRIMLAGTKAPSAVNSQPWEFILVTDPGIIDSLSRIKYEQTLAHPPKRVEGDPHAMEKLARSQKDSFRNASIVAVCHRVEWERSVWMCLQNMSLAAVAEGLGSGIVLYWGETQKAAGKTLGLPGDYEITAVLKIGVPGEEGYSRERNPYAPRRPDFSWLHRDRYRD
jgi:5,6-dimethylbenzimidazole synthase